jgi:photosystem II stability/assembly factor-like uncharacterized protein
MPRLTALLLCTAACVIAACAPPQHESAPGPDVRAAAPVLASQTSGTEALLIGISVVDERVAWVSGTAGTYARTLDGGATWRPGTVPGADSLQFRDVYAVDAATAYLLSAGPGEASRILKTVDGGATWTTQFVNREPEAFYDCFDFWDARSGIAFSDAVGGDFHVVVTEDGGETWTRVPAERLPAAQPGEGSFAASGTCLTVHGDSAAWIGTGNAPVARVLHTPDRGHTWTATPLPLPGGEYVGIASVRFRDEATGAVLGGRIVPPYRALDNVAVTRDGGQTWSAASPVPTASHAVYGAAYVPGSRPPLLVAVGPGGAAYSRDDGGSWAVLDTATYWSTAFASPRAGWMVGPGGRITHVRF